MGKHNELEAVYTGRQLEEKYNIVKDYLILKTHTTKVFKYK